MASGGDSRIYTIGDVAKELGLNKSTVSRAISGKGSLRPETRERVLEFIEAHNFQPNAVAKSLAQSKTYNLALVLPWDYGVTESMFFQDCMRGICEVASEHDYDVLITLISDTSIEQLERVVNNHKVDGVILSRSVANSPAIPLLQAKGIPLIVIGPAPAPGVLYVDNNNRAACRELTMLLLMRGLRRIALIGGRTDHLVTHCRYEGYRSAFEQLGYPVDEELVFMDVDDGKAVQRAVDESLRQGADCIVCMDDYLCNMALRRLRELGVSIPRDIRIASFYDSGSLEHSVPSVTSLKFDTRELGRTVCRKMLELLNQHKTEGCMLPQFELLLRQSTE